MALHRPALQFGLVHISVGDLLRAEVEAGTPAGQKAQQYMDAGNLVPNEVVVEMVTNRLSEADVREHGWLLDGYPRSGGQADAIEQQGIRPDVFILITVSLSAVSGRVVDSWVVLKAAAHQLLGAVVQDSPGSATGHRQSFHQPSCYSKILCLSAVY